MSTDKSGVLLSVLLSVFLSRKWMSFFSSFFSVKKTGNAAASATHEPKAEGGRWVQESSGTNCSSLIVDVNGLVGKNGQLRDCRNNQNPPPTVLSGVGSGNSSKPQCPHR